MRFIYYRIVYTCQKGSLGKEWPASPPPHLCFHCVPVTKLLPSQSMAVPQQEYQGKTVVHTAFLFFYYDSHSGAITNTSRNIFSILALT